MQVWCWALSLGVLFSLNSGAVVRPTSSSKKNSAVVESGKSLKEDASSLCQPDHLTVYKVVLNTYWSREKFPKHYPEWRPPAQWTKLVGRSHDSSYVLFRLGEKASEGLRVFAETGGSDLLDAQTQGEGGVYDEFNAPPVVSGQGRTEAEFFVDGNHSRVSLIAKMVPSPDWFIGIDNFDLCVQGKWMDGLTIEVGPLDAGTDNGFTFTSPNWPTEPRGVVSRITPKHPNHPASSFYYPQLTTLPPIASFQFVKVKEYELSEVFHLSEDSMANDVIRMEDMNNYHKTAKPAATWTTSTTTTTTTTTTTSTTPAPPVVSATLSNAIMDAVPVVDEQQSQPSPVHVKPHKTHTRKKAGLFDAALTPQKVVQQIPPADNKRTAIHHLVDTYQKQHKAKHHPTNGKKPVKKRLRLPRDCQVSDWSEWTPCSSSCDVGESTRTRTVVHHARRGGLPCPPLKEAKWCGSARSCQRSYFNWR